MKFDLFKELLVDELRSHYDEGVKYNFNKVTKNNGVTLQALAIVKEGEVVTPNIYLDEYYKNYSAGIVTIHDIAERIIQVREEASLDVMADFIDSWDDVKDKVFCKIVNKEKNQEKLEEVPYIDFLDLAIIVRVLNKMDEDGVASVMVDNILLKRWGVTGQEVIEQAIHNTQVLFPTKVQSMFEIIMQNVGVPEELVEMEEEETQMHVISNTSGFNGATSMMYKNVLRDTAIDLKVKYFYILPSSVHECIIVTGCDDVQFMKSIVQQVNREQVKDVDYLSDSIYRYDLETNELDIAA